MFWQKWTSGKPNILIFQSRNFISSQTLRFSIQKFYIISSSCDCSSNEQDLQLVGTNRAFKSVDIVYFILFNKFTKILSYMILIVEWKWKHGNTISMVMLQLVYWNFTSCSLCYTHNNCAVVIMQSLIVTWAYIYRNYHTTA